jgi:hypothetical protein
MAMVSEIRVRGRSTTPFIAVFGICRHRALQHADAGDAVDQGVVHLEIDGEAPVFKAFNYVIFPERSVEVHGIAVQP